MRTFFCPQCGNMVMPGLTHCPECGYAFDGSAPIRKVKDTPLPIIKDASQMKAPYLPYEPRPSQLQIISDIRTALDQSRHIVIESGTGTGKTITSLAGALEHAKPRGKKVVYITRTISQSDQVMKELRAISTLKPVYGITLTGRNKSCPLLQARPDFESLSPSALSTLCSDRKAKSQQNRPGGCPFFEETQHNLETVEAYCKKNFPKSDELDVYCRNINVCPYEAKKALMKDFDVVVAPYIHIIDPDIRENFLSNLDTDEKGIVLIVDEAHNIMDAVREQESFSITTRLVMSALDEAGLFKKPEVCDGVTIDAFIRSVRAAMRDIGSKYLGFNEKEKVIPADSLENSVCTALNIDRMQLTAAINRTIELGEKREEAIADTDAPSSPVLEFGRLMEAWVKSPADRYVRAVRSNEDGEYLTASCIDPTDIVRFMNALPGAVHMSGTLQPLAQYARVMGLPSNSVPRTYPSPFPAENKLVVYAKDVTTNYNDLKANPSMWSKIERMTAQMCNAVDKNILVFLPSYRLMKDIRPYMEQSVDKPLYWEESGRQRNTMRSLEAFRRGRNGVFFCVMGGSVAEGMDFPGEELCFAIIIGMPYPPPTIEMKAMKDMFDARYGSGMGWKYTSEIPAVRKIRQAIGRLIRTETDRGMAVILDNRASRNARQLEAVPSDDPVSDAVRFFSKK